MSVLRGFLQASKSLRRALQGECNLGCIRTFFIIFLIYDKIKIKYFKLNKNQYLLKL